ncbi:MAG TPA: 4-hydroxy-tetrahydrodipicolinate reductase [Burkholderiaceae bacterium]|nr:4-hydroxy-tetrahydrodipicolinate reductase [Burkholderiaceae bacterium]
MTLRVAIAGSSGKMGRMLIEALQDSPDLGLAVALDRSDSPDLGRDCGDFLGKRTGVLVGADLDRLESADVLIDFTRPVATLAHLRACLQHRVRMVIGTTGFDPAGRQAIEAAARSIPIVFAPNMSVGVNATFKLLEVAARILATGFDIEVIEAHHRHKVDAPSGTALKMGEVIAAAQGRKLEDVAVFARHGETGERKPGSIGFSSIRGGDIVGDHTVLFAGTGERIEVTHRSASRMTYAIGALRAARFLADRHIGLFDMHDVLGLR